MPRNIFGGLKPEDTADPVNLHLSLRTPRKRVAYAHHAWYINRFLIRGAMPDNLAPRRLWPVREVYVRRGCMVEFSLSSLRSRPHSVYKYADIDFLGLNTCYSA